MQCSLRRGPHAFWASREKGGGRRGRVDGLPGCALWSSAADQMS